MSPPIAHPPHENQQGAQARYDEQSLFQEWAPDSPLPLGARQLSGVERLLWVIDHATRCHMTFELKISGPPPSRDRVVYAYEVMRSQYPLLRIRLRGWLRPIMIEESALRDLSPLSDSLLSAEASSIYWFDREPTQADYESALNTAIDLHRAPPLRLHCFVPNDTHWRALFVVHHMATDGISCLRAIQGFLDALRPDDPRPPLRPPKVEWSSRDTLPSAELIPMSARTLWAKIRSALRRCRDHLQWCVRGYPRLLPLDHPTPFTQREVGFTRRLISADITRELREYARHLGLSLHALMGAAQLFAIRDELSAQESLTLSIYSPTNLRPRLTYPDGAPVPEGHMGQLVGYAQSSVHLTSSVELTQVATSISEQLRALLSVSDDVTIHHLSDQLAHWIDHPRRWRKLAQATPRTAISQRASKLAQTLERSIFHSTVLSSVGEARLSLDPRIGVLDEVGVSSCPGAMNTWISVATSQDHSLYWSFTWARPCVTDERAERLADRAVHHLISSLQSPVSKLHSRRS